MISSSIFKNVFQRSRFLISSPGSAIAMPKVIRTAAQQSHAKEEIKPPNNEHLVMEILSDFAEKHGGSPSFGSELWKLLLASARLKELGVGFNPAPIPDKQDWKASWHKQGKPDWLGTTPTKADGKLQHSASITGYVEERTADGGGGYGVILFDNYGRPKVASVGVSPVRHVPLVYY